MPDVEDRVPTIGAHVHYVSYGTPGGEFTSECRAAVVTEVGFTDRGGATHVGVCVMNPSGLFFNRDVQFGVAAVGGTWHWPRKSCR